MDWSAHPLPAALGGDRAATRAEARFRWTIRRKKRIDLSRPVRDGFSSREAAFRAANVQL